MTLLLLRRVVTVLSVLLVGILLSTIKNTRGTRAAPESPSYYGSLSKTVAYTYEVKITLTISNLMGEVPPSSKWYGPDGSQVSPTCIAGQVVREFVYNYGSLFEVKDHFYIQSCNREPGTYRVTVGTEIDKTFLLKEKLYYAYLPLVLNPPQPPGQFNKLSPIDATTGQSLSLTLDWEDSSNADSYEYCLDTLNDGNCEGWVDTGTTSQANLAGLDTETTYYWQVRAINDYGTTFANADSFDYWSFTTGDGSPGPFVKNTPSDGAVGMPVNLTLDWGDSNEADSYEYCYDTTDDGDCTGWLDTGSTSQASLFELDADITYYWQVRANNSLGTTYAGGVSTNYWSFTTSSGVVPGEMVLIPAGEFTMGCDPEYNLGLSCYDEEVPTHTVSLDAYLIDRYEVTNGEYADCVLDGACSAPEDTSSSTRSPYYGDPDFVDYPVIQVTWQDAYDYCTWTGKRLPTEAEWEKAARGTSMRTYPWGEADPDCILTNAVDSGTYEECIGDTSLVGDHPLGASPYGIMDMAGNVAEWVNDWYDPDYYAESPASNPPGPDTGTERVKRGGGFRSWPYDLVISYRGHRNPSKAYDDLGFRCAVTYEQP